MTRWTPRALAAVRRAAELHGLRAICAYCQHEQRHFPSNGRLREARCDRCGHRTLRLLAWTQSHDARWQQAKDEARARFR